MNKNIVELFSLDIDNNTVFVATNPATRELSFYIKEQNQIIPLPKEMYDLVSSKIFTINKPEPSFDKLLKTLVEKYSQENLNKSYDNSNLNRNWKNIRIFQNQSNLNTASAYYDAINNILNFELPKELFSFSTFIPLKIKAMLHTTLVHEIGHMSVSELSIENNYLVSKVGFYEMKFPLKECISTTDGYNYFRIDPKIEPQKNEGKGLEELFNELETDRRTNNSIAPRFAYELDELTNKKLQTARQNHSLDTYYNIMQEIIPSIDMAKVLLIALNKYYELLNNKNYELVTQITSLINNLIFEYQIAKAQLKKRD